MVGVEGRGGAAPREPGAAARLRALATGLLLAFLALPLLSTFGYSAQYGAATEVAFYVLRAAITALQLLHSLPSLLAIRRRWWKWTFAAQGMLTFLPYLAFHDRWASGGALAASAVLLLDAPMSLLAGGLVLIAVAAIEAAYSGGFGIAMANTVDGSLVTAMATYGLTRLTEVAEELDATQEATADAVAGQERLRAARHVYALLAPRLSDVARSAEQARACVLRGVADAGALAARVGTSVREALADARVAAQTYRTPERSHPSAAPDLRVDTEPRIAFAIVVVMSITGALVNFFHIAGDARRGGGALVAAAAGLGGLVALQAYHGAPRSDRAPRGLPWTLGAQALLVYAPVPVFGTDWIGMACYFAACVLLILRPPLSWFTATLITATGPIVFAASSASAPETATQAIDDIWTVLIFYGPTLLAREALRLRAARGRLARMLLVKEHLQLARDMHDLLGAGLSAAALKADLAERLLSRDPQRAAAELSDVAALARRAVDEAKALSGTSPNITLLLELDAARSVLAAAGIDAHVSTPEADLPRRIDTALAVVTREAVTNVLRHSAAQRCTIALSVNSATARLEVINDGLNGNGIRTPGEVADGNGIGNLDARIQALAGCLTAQRVGEHDFHLIAEIPIEPPTPAER